MVKKEYIFNCYLAALKKFSEISDCTCNLKKHKDIDEENGDGNKTESIDMERSCKIHHNHFLNPDVNCYNLNHIECNDPIFRFFEYAKLADRKAKTNLDYQKEYEKIAKHCRELSADLLTKCNKTSEIEQVLDEVSGSSNYFRYYHEMKYPRLRLSLEQHHDNFIGHIYR